MSSQSSIPILLTVSIIAGGALWMYSKNSNSGPSQIDDYDPFDSKNQRLTAAQIATYKARDEKVSNYYKNNVSYIARLDYADAHSDGITHSTTWDAAYKTTLSPLWDPIKGGFKPALIQPPPVKIIIVPHDDYFTAPAPSSDPIAAMKAGKMLDSFGHISGTQLW